MTPEQLTEIFKHYKPPFTYHSDFARIKDADSEEVLRICFDGYKGRVNITNTFGQWVADTLNEKWEHMKMTPTQIDSLAEEIWNRHGWEYQRCDKKTTFIWAVKLGIKFMTDEKDKRST